jgi:hypothetical protein
MTKRPLSPATFAKSLRTPGDSGQHFPPLRRFSAVSSKEDLQALAALMPSVRVQYADGFIDVQFHARSKFSHKNNLFDIAFDWDGNCPGPHRFIVTSRSDPAAVGSEYRSQSIALVHERDANWLSGRLIPQAGLAFPTADEKRSSI